MSNDRIARYEKSIAALKAKHSEAKKRLLERRTQFRATDANDALRLLPQAIADLIVIEKDIAYSERMLLRLKKGPKVGCPGCSADCARVVQDPSTPGLQVSRVT